MAKYLIVFFALAFWMGSCVPASPAPLPTGTIIESTTPPFAVTPTVGGATLMPDTTSFSIEQIRTPKDMDGRQVLTVFWLQDESIIYYALVKEYFTAPLWFESQINEDGSVSHKPLSSAPKITYPPSFPTGGIYLEYRGLVSPSNRYYFQRTQAENDSLYLLDNMEQSKVKLLETSDMNFREAYWAPDENKVVFGIGPEYGTEFYLYEVGEKKLRSFEKLFGYTDPNVSEWALSPNGKYIAILDGNQELKLFSLDGSFTTTLSGHINNVRWTGNSEKIFYYSGTQLHEPASIACIDVVNKITTSVVTFSELKKLGVHGFFDVSPDGTQLAFWQAGNIWLVSLE